jgi:hypothetical protein
MKKRSLWPMACVCFLCSCWTPDQARYQLVLAREGGALFLCDTVSGQTWRRQGADAWEALPPLPTTKGASTR